MPDDPVREEILNERNAALMQYFKRIVDGLREEQQERDEKQTNFLREVTAPRQAPKNDWRGKIIAALVTLAVAGVVGAAGIVYGYGDRLITVETTQDAQGKQITEIKNGLKDKFRSIDEKQDSTNSKLDTLIGAFEESRRK